MLAMFSAPPAARTAGDAALPRHRQATHASRSHGMASSWSCRTGTGRSLAPLQAAKDGELALSGVVFEPFEAVQEELAVVERAGNTTGESLARSIFHEEVEAAINAQINAELTFSYVYHAMYNYFNRDNVGLPGFARYFYESSQEERHHAELLMDQQTRRGGRVQLLTILAPSTMEFDHADKGDGLWSMELALAMEKLNFHKLRQVHAIAAKHEDAQTTQFIEDHLLQEQAADIKILANYVSMLRRVGKGHGVFHFDRYLYDNREALGYDGIAHYLANGGGSVGAGLDGAAAGGNGAA